MKTRIITGVLLAAGFLAVLWSGGIWFAGLITLMAVLGYYEYIRLNRLKWSDPVSLAGFLGVICIVFPWESFFHSPPLNFESVVWSVMLLLLAATVASKNRVNLQHAAIHILGVIYIGTGFHYMIVTRMMDDHGLFWAVLIFGCIWLTDIGAYFSGRAAGKRPLWPEISPNKTVEGAVGGLFFSVVIAVVLSLFAAENVLSQTEALGLGLAIGILAQLGDLIESAYKRAAGAKDSGELLPGHGGILDRCDSWLIVFPFIHIFLMPLIM